MMSRLNRLGMLLFGKARSPRSCSRHTSEIPSRSKAARLSLCVGVFGALAVTLPAQRLVVGHQMSAMPRYGGSTSVEQMREEVRQWKDLGLDGVMLFDIGGTDAGGQGLASNILRYHEAGVAEGFKFAVSVSYFQASDVDRQTAFLRGLGDPKYAAARLLKDGRVYLSSYHGSTNLVTAAAALNASGYPVTLEPMAFCRGFNGDYRAQRWESGYITGATPETWNILTTHPDWQSTQGFAAFEITRSLAEQANQIDWLWNAAHAQGKTARGSIVAYYKGFGHKGNWMVYEGWGFARLQGVWQRAVSSGIPAVEFITLNDFCESTYFNSWAADDPPLIVNHWNTGDVPAILDHSGFREFSKRYVQWFKTGIEPAITKDELYYAYRLHPRNATDYVYLAETDKTALARYIPAGQNAASIYRKDGLPSSYSSWGNWNVGIDWTKFSDGIHAAVRLTAPAEVWINGVKVGDAPAGESLWVKPGAIAAGDSGLGYPLYTFGPADYGFPRFELRRGGQTLLSHTGELEITPFAVPGCWNIFARKAPAAGDAPPAPLAVALTAPAQGQAFAAGDPVNLTASPGGDTSRLARVEFYDGATKLGERTAAPWSMSWTGASAGTHNLSAKAINSDASSATSAGVSITVTAPPAPAQRSPYQGVRQSIGGRIEVEYYDEGGAGLAYADNTAANQGGALRTDGVDIEVVNGSGHGIGFFQAGEWMLYSVNATKSARYRATVRVACAQTGGTFRVELDGQDISGLLTVPNTGSWVNWQDITFEADIPAGFHDLRIVGVQNYNYYVGDLDYIDFAEVAVAVPTITSPVAGALFEAGSPIALTASLAGDVSQVARVEFFDADARIGERTAAPWSISWNGAAAGSHTLTARAVTTLGAAATSASVSISVRAPAPTPTLTAPSAGSSFNVGATIVVSASLAGATGELARVEFFDGAAKLGERTAAPWSISWNGATAGAHMLAARAVNASGAAATSVPVSIVVNASPPVPTITTPATGTSTTAGTITVAATLAGSTAQLARVEFFDGASRIGERSAAPWSISWGGASVGSHVLTARAVTTTGASATSTPVAITVQLPAPTPTIVTPAAGETFNAGSSIPVAVVLAGDVSQLARVEFFADAAKIGERTAAPWSLAWIGAASGDHVLAARAVNTSGVSASSNPVPVTVHLPATPEAGATINVRDYGALGDGVADDTAAIAEALAAIGPAGGTLYLPAGVYCIAPQASGGSALAIEWNDLAIRGDGPDATILSLETFGGGDPETNWETLAGRVHRGSAIVIQGTASRADPRRGVTIADLRITGNATPTGSFAAPASPVNGTGWDPTHRAIVLAPDTFISGVRLQNLELDSFRGEIVYATGSTNGLLEIAGCRIHGSDAVGVSASADLRLIANDIYDHAYACVVAEHFNRPAGFEQHGYFLGNTFEPRRTLATNGLNGLVLRGEGEASVATMLAADPLVIVLQNNRFKNSLHHGIVADRSLFDAVIEQNRFEDNGTSGDALHGHVALAPAAGASSPAPAVDGVVIRDNLFTTSAGQTSGYALFLDAGAAALRNVEMSNNAVTTPPGTAATIRRYLMLASLPGSEVGGLVFENNVADRVAVAVEDSTKATHKTPRPRFGNNTVTATALSPGDDDFQVRAGASDICPAWTGARVTPASEGLSVTLEPWLDLYPDFAAITLTASEAGFVLSPKASWNRFASDTYVPAGSSVTLVKKAGRFELRAPADREAGPVAPSLPPPPAPLVVSLASPAPGATLPAGQPVTFTAAFSGQGSPVTRVEFFVDGVKIGERTSAPYALEWAPPAAGAFSAYARALDSEGRPLTSTAVVFTVAPPPGAVVPADAFARAEIGAPARTGSSSFESASATYLEHAAGAGFGGTSDQFRFAQDMFEGDGELIVRVASLDPTDPWAQAGLMIRNSLEPAAAHASVFVTPGHGVVFQYRAQVAAAAIATAGLPAPAPVWLRLRREGSQFIGFSSIDGTTWTEVGRAVMAMPQLVHAGLATSSRNPALLTAATYDSLAIRPLDELYTTSDIGAVGTNGYGLHNPLADTCTLAGAGRDLWGRSDAFTFQHRTICGDATIITRLDEFDAAHPWAKAGLMVRDGLAADAANVFIGVTPANGIVVHARTAPGALTTETLWPGVAAPVSLALERVGNQVTAYFSADGTNWQRAGSFDLPLSSAVQLGMAVTSRDPSTLATARFSETGVVP